MTAERRTRKQRSDAYLSAYVGRGTVIAFFKEARRRHIPISRLIARTLQCVAAGNLFDAVIDNKETDT